MELQKGRITIMPASRCDEVSIRRRRKKLAVLKKKLRVYEKTLEQLTEATGDRSPFDLPKLS
jgi:hypothetical protein